MNSTSALLIIGKNRRSRTEIIVTIITLAQNGKSIAEIMGEAHLNYPQVKRYLEEIDKLGLIEMKHAERRKVYITSQRGNQFLRQYSILRKFLS